MKVYFEKDNRNEELEFSGTVAGLLEQLGLNSEEVLVVRGGDALLDEDEVTNQDEIKLLSVISGG